MTQELTSDLTASTSLSRGVSLFSMFTLDDDTLSVGELARRSGQPKTTVHRLVRDLVATGLLEKTPTGVRLGIRLFELGHRVFIDRLLSDAAGVIVQRLSELTQLTTNVAVMRGPEIVYLEKVDHSGGEVRYTREGGRLPTHCTALGKAILAFSQDEQVQQVISGGLRPATPYSISKPDQLRTELDVVRRQKVAFDNQETRVGFFAVAAPIFSEQLAIGAISLAGATDSETVRRHAPVVVGAAQAITNALRRGGSG